MPLRRLSRAAHALAIVLALISTACGPEALDGTDLGRRPAPDFTLTDATSGKAVSLSSLRGNAIAMAFLYTRCPDVCPLTAELFRQARQRLGGDAARVRFVAVTVDPEHDTPDAVRDFSAKHRLSEGWHYLIGPREALAAVWKAYGIGVEPGDRAVGHTEAIYLIDPQGNARALVHTVDGVEPLLRDLRILAREK